MGDSVLSRLERLGLAAGQPVLVARHGADLHAMLSSVGRERRNERGYDWDGLTRVRGGVGFALLQHTFAGRGRLLYEGRAMTVEPGQTLLLRFPHANRYWTEPGDDWDFFYLCVHGREAMRLWGEALSRLGPVARLSAATLEVAAEACLTALQGRLRGPGHASALAYGVAAALVDEAVAAPEPANRDPAIQRAVDRVHDRLDQPLDVEDLAAVAGYSRWHFTRLFQQSEGLAPAAYLMHQRMKRAAGLLQATDLPVKQIASQCGYDDPNTFAKAFRRVYDASPTAFRRSGMYVRRPEDPGSR